MERNTPMAGGSAVIMIEKSPAGEIPGGRLEFWRMKDSVSSVTVNPSADLKNPVLRSSDVSRPKLITLIM